MAIIRTLFLLTLICFTTAISFAQSMKDSSHEDVLYLHDGSIFRGKLLEYNVDGLVVFETYQGIKLSLNVSQVQKVQQEVLDGGSANKSGDRESRHQFKEKGVYWHLSGGFSAGYDAGASLTQTVGYRFSRMSSLGIGTGIQNFQLGYGRQLIPIYAEFRSFLGKKNISPMVGLKAGYGIALKNEAVNIISAKGGALIAPEFGYRFGGRNAHFTLSAAMHFQWAEFTEDNPWWNPWIENGTVFTEKLRYQRLELRAGLMF